MTGKMKSIFTGLALIFSLGGYSQGLTIKETPNNWHLLDKNESGYYGISLDKAYTLLKGKKSKTVIVAVIDSGIDSTQEDLKSILWTNPGEIPGNGIDDDHNGYVDDVHGWNFIGGKDGRNVNQDSDEGSRVYKSLKEKYGENPDASKVDPKDKEEFEMYLKAKKKVEGKSEKTSEVDLMFLKRILITLKKDDTILQSAMNKKTFTGKELDDFSPSGSYQTRAKVAFLGLMKANNSYEQTNTQFISDLDSYVTEEETKSMPIKEYRAEIVKDDETNINDRFYGNNDIMAESSSHGTHCSGIIAAIRNNGKGMNGIADNVRIMMVRAVPNGDEHDKDIANAIRYAVDNGAQVISMSFGKDFSPQKQWVDDAVKYAESKNVLMIHAAGNDNKNIDSADNFPNPVYKDKSGRASNFITVGASGDPTNGGIIANFSNYGRKEVDVFAPGVQIYSTLPGGNTYGKYSGTSMAGPVVAGIGALLLEYFPDLSAKQLKYIIEKSAAPLMEKVKLPGNPDELVDLIDISKTGGIVNAYEAVKIAMTIKGDRNIKQGIKPRSRMKHRIFG